MCLRDAISVGGKSFGTSTFLNLQLMSLQAILNSIKSILPSASVSASALCYKSLLKQFSQQEILITHQICPRSKGESPDFKRNPLACVPVTIPLTGPSALNCVSNRSFSLAVTTNGSRAFMIFLSQYKILQFLRKLFTNREIRGLLDFSRSPNDRVHRSDNFQPFSRRDTLSKLNL